MDAWSAKAQQVPVPSKDQWLVSDSSALIVSETHCCAGIHRNREDYVCNCQKNTLSWSLSHKRYDKKKKNKFQNDKREEHGDLI